MNDIDLALDMLKETIEFYSCYGYVENLSRDKGIEEVFKYHRKAVRKIAKQLEVLKKQIKEAK